MNLIVFYVHHRKPPSPPDQNFGVFPAIIIFVRFSLVTFPPILYRLIKTITIRMSHKTLLMSLIQLILLHTVLDFSSLNNYSQLMFEFFTIKSSLQGKSIFLVILLSSRISNPNYTQRSASTGTYKPDLFMLSRNVFFPTHAAIFY